MTPNRQSQAIAIVGVGALLPDAPDVPSFWKNICERRYSITEVPPERWSVDEYYDPDPSVPDKSYSKIGAWVRGYSFDWQRYRVPPKVSAAMDQGQQWAVTVASEALADYGFPARTIDLERTGVVLGAAMGGELHYLTSLRVMFPEFRQALEEVEAFADLAPDIRRSIVARWQQAVRTRLPPITEDSMPGELPNIISGRVANLLDLRGPNFITDAACASSLAAIDAAMDLLSEHQCDAVISGGVDRNMGPSTFAKFCKIGALSATGTRPFGEGADGFVMGEGAAAFLLKRLADAERAGDRIYAVLRGVGAASDGKGKGITAPNPIGQKLAVRRAWDQASLDPATARLVEAHGTSTKVGDVVEVESLAECFASAGRGAIALGSVKSNIGHLKAGAGAAGLLKAVLALHHKMLPPTLHATRPNPSVDFRATPFTLIHELREWPRLRDVPRRAGVSAYGFGGTNFHVVLEEYAPGVIDARRLETVPEPTTPPPADGSLRVASISGPKPPPRGVLALGAATVARLRTRLEHELARAKDGVVPPVEHPSCADLRAKERLVIDFEPGRDLVQKLERARQGLETDAPMAWRALASQGIFRGFGPPSGKIAFLFPGQGSQFVNMGRLLYERERAVRAVFDEADAVLKPILGRPLTEFLFADRTDSAASASAEEALRQTAITQPAVLTVDHALCALLAEYGIRPDYLMGHSLGEYSALVAAGAMPFGDALEAAAARGREMTQVSLADNGWMAAVMGPIDVVEKVLASIDGYVVTANINSTSQAVIGGETRAVQRAMDALQALGIETVRLPVSHAFHTRVVAPAAEALGKVLDRLRISSPQLPVVANVTGELYPSARQEIRDMLVKQIASPVQWVRGLETLWREGVRTFVEVGPKKVLKGFVDDVLGGRDGLVSLFTNHPKIGEVAAFNQALCGLFAAGHSAPAEPAHDIGQAPAPAVAVTASVKTAPPAATKAAPRSSTPEAEAMSNTSLDELARVFARTLVALIENPDGNEKSARVLDRNAPPAGSVVITGCGLGLPGPEKPIMDPQNVDRILRGEQLIDLLPVRFRELMARKHVTRIVKSAEGDGRLETIDDSSEVLKLAGRPGAFDLTAEYGVPKKLVEALDSTTQLAIAVGIDALREAGIPLVQTWHRTTKGSFLPSRWVLPESMRDETGVIFASAFPGFDRFAEELGRYYRHETRRARRATLEEVRHHASDAMTLRAIQRQIAQVDEELRREPYAFDRRFLLRILPMGHSQFAEYIGARGPNASANAACASMPQAIAMAEDWIRSGRCRRVIVISADNTTSENLMEWVGAGFLATGAAATDDKIEEAALPFDRRRHGTIVGMGAAALVVESQDAVEERGMRGIAELLSSETRNSAFHATRLDVEHVAVALESLVRSAERRFGLDRRTMAAETVFMSHETFTPARGGSASAEVEALRHVFGNAIGEIVVANTKGFTGHAMGAGIEDVISLKILERGIVPPVPNFREEDPELGRLNLSRGGRYPVSYAIHLAAGFGSQIALTLARRISGGTERVDRPDVYRRWLDGVAGMDHAETEVVLRTLRVVSRGPPARPPRPAVWTWGTAPARRAPAPPAPAGIIPATEVSAVASSSASALDSASPSLAAPVAHAVAPTTPLACAPTPEPPAHPSSAAAGTVTEMPNADSPGADAVAGRVVAIVAEKTGYPPDLLDLDLDLEADLGIDTVKQAETFAAVREEWSIPRVESLRLRDFPTLRHVIAFVHTHRSDPSDSQAAPPPASAPGAGATSDTPSLTLSSPAVDPVTARVVAIVSEKTGYPADLLDLDLDLEADLGVDTVKQAETFAAVREEWSIPQVEALRLRDFPTLRHVVAFVLAHRPELAATQSAPAPVSTPRAACTAEAPLLATEPPAADLVTARVVAIVSEKTGYPPDLLDLDLDLEADLGVDTVKQAETFAAVREEWSIPRMESLQLRDFPTLRHVIAFVHTHRPTAPASPSAAALPPEAETAFAGSPTAPAKEPPASRAYPLANADQVPRRVAAPVLRPPLDLCTESGVHIGKGTRVIVARGASESILSQKLADLGADVLELETQQPAQALVATVQEWLAGGPVHGIFWLPSLDTEKHLEEMTIEEFRERNRVIVKNLASVMRALYESVSHAGTFLVAATSLGGYFGLGDDGTDAPLGGAVQGFVKAYKRERPDVLAKVVDFPRDVSRAEIADVLLAETLLDASVVEVGRRAGQRWSINLDTRPVPASLSIKFDRDSVFVVTGAAGGITSEIVADLAAASGGTFHLLDLIAPPPPDDPLVALFRSGRDRLKERLIEAARDRGERPTPVAIDRQILFVERQDAALRALEGVQAAGGTAHWHVVDLLDPASVEASVQAIRSASGRIDALVHAAGIEVSRALSNKPDEEWARVFDIKADGFFSLLRAVRDMPLGATVVFSSVAGRFGNGGQTDYSAGNALLCSMSRSLRQSRPRTPAVAIDWTAWGEIGMSVRGSIPKIIKAAGIDMLGPEIGIPTVRRELVAGSADEIVVGGRLGDLAKEWDTAGGLDLAKTRARVEELARDFTMVGKVTGAPLYQGLLVETRLVPSEQPFLFDHQIDGIPVLPGAMAAEAFAEVASVLCPGWVVTGLRDVEFLLPFKFHRMKPATLYVTAVGRPGAGDALFVDVQVSSRLQPKPGAPMQERLHSRARVIAERAPLAGKIVAVRPPTDITVDHRAIYRVYFHGPAYQVLTGVRLEPGSAIGIMRPDLTPNTENPHAAELVAPRLIELCFQTAGILDIAGRNALGLPAAVSSLRVFRPTEASNCCLFSEVRRREQGDGFDARVIDSTGNVYIELEGYRTVALPTPTTLAQLLTPVAEGAPA